MEARGEKGLKSAQRGENEAFGNTSSCEFMERIYGFHTESDVEQLLLRASRSKSMCPRRVCEGCVIYSILSHPYVVTGLAPGFFCPPTLIIGYMFVCLSVPVVLSISTLHQTRRSQACHHTPSSFHSSALNMFIYVSFRLRFFN